MWCHVSDLRIKNRTKVGTVQSVPVRSLWPCEIFTKTVLFVYHPVGMLYLHIVYRMYPPFRSMQRTGTALMASPNYSILLNVISYFIPKCSCRCLRMIFNFCFPIDNYTSSDSCDACHRTRYLYLEANSHVAWHMQAQPPVWFQVIHW